MKPLLLQMNCKKIVAAFYMDRYYQNPIIPSCYTSVLLPYYFAFQYPQFSTDLGKGSNGLVEVLLVVCRT